MILEEFGVSVTDFLDYMMGGASEYIRKRIEKMLEKYTPEAIFKEIVKKGVDLTVGYIDIDCISSLWNAAKIFDKKFADEVKELVELAGKTAENLVPKIENYQIYTPDFLKQKYVDIARVFLGLQADATIERMTPEAMREIDLFLADCSICTQKVDFVARAMLYGALANGGMWPLLSYVKETINFLKDCENKYQDIKRKVRIYPTCYALNKRKYSQSLQFIFFNQ